MDSLPAIPNSPENRSRRMALFLTLTLWAGLAILLVLLPSRVEVSQEPPQYREISLRLVSSPAALASGFDLNASDSRDVDSGAVDLGGTEGTGTETETGGVAVDSSTGTGGSAAPDIGRSTETSSAELSAVPAATENVFAAPISPTHAPALTPRSAPDPQTMDAADWEALFSGSRSYANSSVADSNSAATSNYGGTGTNSAAAADSLSGVAAEGSTMAAEGSTIAATLGSAGESGSSTETSAATASVGTAASAETAERLDRIARAAAGRDGAKSDSGGGGMDSGAVVTRSLLEPAEPVIRISQKNQALIPGDLEVTIIFEITPEGLVRPGSVKITPESLVHPQVQAEIRTQIGKWRFQSAGGSGQASFKYNIIKK